MADRSNIRTRARTRADQTNSTKPSDTEYNLFIDEACKKTWGELIQGGWPVDTTDQTITATGAATYAIGSGVNIFGVNGVFYVSGGTYTELRRVNQADVAALRSQGAANNVASFYEVRISPTTGMVIELYPRVSGGSYLVKYTPDHAGLVNDAAIWYGPNRSDELVVLDAAAKGLRNEGMDRDGWVLEQERAKLLELVLMQASQIDQRNSPRIRDTTRATSQDPFDFNVWPGTMY